jgi:hypothetical protein
LELHHGKYPFLTLYTLVHVLFTNSGFGPSFYPNHSAIHKNGNYSLGDKVIPLALLDSFLTPLALAFWFMGDGAIYNNNYVLCTDSFELSSIQLLIEF